MFFSNEQLLFFRQSYTKSRFFRNLEW